MLRILIYFFYVDKLFISIKGFPSKSAKMVLILKVVPSDENLDFEQSSLEYSIRKCDKIPRVLGQLKISRLSESDLIRTLEFGVLRNNFFDVDAGTGWVTLKRKIDENIKKIVTAQVWANLTISANRTKFVEATLRLKASQCTSKKLKIISNSFSAVVDYRNGLDRLEI